MYVKHACMDSMYVYIKYSMCSMYVFTGWMDGWMHRCMDVKMDGWMDVYMDRWMYGWMYRWIIIFRTSSLVNG